MQDILIIHHRNCFDGIAAAWAASLYFRARYHEKEITFHAADYGTPPPDCTGKHTYIVDFSYPREILEEMQKKAHALMVLDHHKTAQEALKGFEGAIFDMDRSGAGITWDWFFSRETRPWLIDCIEDRDLWRFKLPNTKRQMAYIATLPMNVTSYDFLSSLKPDEVARKGDAILSYITNYGHKAIEHAVMREIGGYSFWVINISYQNCSDHLDLLMSEKEFDRAAYFFLHGSGQWQFGMRSRGEFDVSEIAKQYGGGGHKNAAGFVVDKLPWETR